MADSIQKMEVEIEYDGVKLARRNIELRILKAKEEIARLEQHIEIQKQKESELAKKLEQL